MQYLAEATDLLEASNQPTSGRVILVIDSLENALKTTERSTPAINALCERLLHGLQQRFSYLLDSSVHQAATALDPQIKLTFTDNSSSKYFIFLSTTVKEKIMSLLPQSVSISCQSPASFSDNQANPLKRKSLLDHSSSSTSTYTSQGNSLSKINIELRGYLDSPCLQIKPIDFWSQRTDSPLKTLALQLLSVLSSSAPVQRLFSKAGVILNQRKTRLSSNRLEQLLAFH